MSYVLPDWLYQVLKWGCATMLPAAATLVKALGVAWGWDEQLCDAIATTFTAVAAFGGIVLGITTAAAKKISGGESA